MKRFIVQISYLVLCLSVISLIASEGASFSNVPIITKDKLKSLLDDPGTIIIDVRHPRNWEQSGMKIRGALYENPFDEEKSWAGRYPKDKNIVLY